MDNRCPTCGVTSFRLGYFPSRRPGVIKNRHGRARRVVTVWHGPSWRRRMSREHYVRQVISWRERRFTVFPSRGGIGSKTVICCTDPWHEIPGNPPYTGRFSDTPVSQRLPRQHDPKRSRRKYLNKRQLQGKDRR